MANEIQASPNTVPGLASVDWVAELNLRELSMKGYDGISLTEWAAGDTDKPQIAAGSVIEIDGAIAKFTNQTALTDEGGLADGWCYIKFVVSGSDVVPTLTNTFGTWDTAKQGFYTAGNRFSLHAMYRSGAVTKIFTAKHLINLSTVYDDYSNSGFADKDSDVYAGQKIKQKIIKFDMNGVSSLSVAHGISNAYTSHRILSVFCTVEVSASSVIVCEENGGAAASYCSTYNDTNLAIVRASAPGNYVNYAHVIYV